MLHILISIFWLRLCVSIVILFCRICILCLLCISCFFFTLVKFLQACFVYLQSCHIALHINVHVTLHIQNIVHIMHIFRIFCMHIVVPINMHSLAKFPPLTLLAKAKAGPVTLTQTAWVQFLPSECALLLCYKLFHETRSPAYFGYVQTQES